MIDERFFGKAINLTLKQALEIGRCKLQSPLGISEEELLNQQIRGFATIDNARSKDITFLINKKYIDNFGTTNAGFCIVDNEVAKKLPQKIPLLVSDSPHLAYALIVTSMYPNLQKDQFIHQSTSIHETASIGENCLIEPGVIIGANVVIGKNTRVGAGAVILPNVIIGQNCDIGPNSYISYAMIGNDCKIYPGVKIGQDGFGFANDKGSFVKIPQLGRVIIGNKVEIGSNSCIDRGSIGDTVISDGCMLDNLVMLGHNVHLGKGCILVSQVGIAGSTHVGDYVTMGGQAGIAGHLKIGSGAQIAAKAGVMHDVPEKSVYSGIPAIPIKKHFKMVAMLNKLIDKKA